MPQALIPNPNAADGQSTATQIIVPVDFIDYPGPPTENPPVTLGHIVADSEGQQWQYYQNDWH
jgi:hypothetical protein